MTQIRICPRCEERPVKRYYSACGKCRSVGNELTRYFASIGTPIGKGRHAHLYVIRRGVAV